MPARPAAPLRERDYDFSNVGKVGRRTGVTLAPREVDEHGLENMSGMFSSPKKPSPVADKRALVESIEADGEVTPRTGKPQTPSTSTTVRRSTRGSSHPLPHSASPRKSGISGSARRMGANNALAQSQLEQETEEAQTQNGSVEADDSRLSTTPAQVPNMRAASARPATVRRFSPERTPLRNRVLNRASKSAFAGRVSDVQPVAPEPDAEEEDDTQPDETPSHIQITNDVHASDVPPVTENSVVVDDEVNMMGDEEDNESSAQESEPDEPRLPPVPIVEQDNEDDADFEPEKRRGRRKGQPNKANSRRKRKSDAMDEDEAATLSSPAAKRAKRRSKEGLPTNQKQTTHNRSSQRVPAKEPSQNDPSRRPLANKPINNHMSEKQRKELDEAVDKIRARPGQTKSLYVLRRETPTDDAVSHTRSGRISIKPLAWWRNEGVIYGGSSGGIADGQRFPLNSIKEIIRTEESIRHVKGRARSKSKRKKGKGKERQDEESSTSDIDLDGHDDYIDPDADDWELDTGTLRGNVSVWDADQQAPVEDEEEVDIAHAAAAIQTKEVKGSTFRYAKLLSTRFFGTGVVDLPPGGVKKPKNSRKMHMSFFVAQGRVTVEVGPLNAQSTRFSIGKGGLWQVPRGNQYSIENEYGKPARIFFSQACEPVPADLEE